MAEDDYSSFLQPVTKILHNLDPILCDLLQSDVRRPDSVTTVRVTGTTLIPLDDGKCLLPRTIHLGHRPLRFAGSAVNYQKHRITRICTPDVDPLTEPADGLERRLADAGAKRCRRYSDRNSQDELRGANRERTAVQVHIRIRLGFVSCEGCGTARNGDSTCCQFRLQMIFEMKHGCCGRDRARYAGCRNARGRGASLQSNGSSHQTWPGLLSSAHK